jgi:hypothetical protein
LPYYITNRLNVSSAEIIRGRIDPLSRLVYGAGVEMALRLAP